jgi:hypothetical protein
MTHKGTLLRQRGLLELFRIWKALTILPSTEQEDSLLYCLRSKEFFDLKHNILNVEKTQFFLRSICCALNKKIGTLYSRFSYSKDRVHLFHFGMVFERIDILRWHFLCPSCLSQQDRELQCWQLLVTLDKINTIISPITYIQDVVSTFLLSSVRY